MGCMIRKVSAEDIAIRGNGTGLEYMCPTRHFVYIFFNPVFQVSTAKNEINLFNNQVLIVAPVTFAPAGAMTPSTEFLLACLDEVQEELLHYPWHQSRRPHLRLSFFKSLYFPDHLIDLGHTGIWYDDRYSSKVVFSNTPAHYLKVKVRSRSWT